MGISALELLDALYGSESPDRRTRVNHAQGVTVEGVFTATPIARTFSEAEALDGTPASARLRFSNSSGIPDIADSDPRASPRGLALSIQPARGRASTFVGHSVEGFPASTPEQFSAFISAIRDPETLAAYLLDNRDARSFLSRLPPTPSSFALEDYHFLHAYALTRGGVERVGRISIRPPASGNDRATEIAGSSVPLGEELLDRTANRGVRLRMQFQLATPADDVHDIASPWEGRGRRIDIGEIRVDRVAADQVAAERTLFDPGELAAGIDLVGDPMTRIRGQVYRLSHRRRSG